MKTPIRQRCGFAPDSVTAQMERALRRIASKLPRGRMHRGFVIRRGGPDGLDRCDPPRRCPICIARNVLWRLR